MQDDPPDCVKQDAFYTPEEFAAQEYLEARHNPFSSAARLEHLNESEAIKESKRQESQVRQGLHPFFKLVQIKVFN